MVAPSGEQHEIVAGGYRAVVTECGASLRLLEYDGHPLVLGWDEGEQTSAGRGQLLAPWPNRIRDGRYTYQGRELQLPLSEPALGNASHGLVRWAPWTMQEGTEHEVSLAHRLMSQPGYPWTLDLSVRYDEDATEGLTVTFTATNLSGSAAPYALGAHPYLTTGSGPVDEWELTVPARTRLRVDDQLIPVGRDDVAGTELDFRRARPSGRRAWTPRSPSWTGTRAIVPRWWSATPGPGAGWSCGWTPDIAGCRCSPATACRSTHGRPWPSSR